MYNTTLNNINFFDDITRNGAIVASLSPSLYSRMLDIIANISSDGVYTSSIHGSDCLSNLLFVRRVTYTNAIYMRHTGCVWQGTLCANEGQCISDSCSCNNGRQGTFCEEAATSSDTLLVGLTGVCKNCHYCFR